MESSYPHQGVTEQTVMTHEMAVVIALSETKMHMVASSEHLSKMMNGKQQ